LFLGGLVLLSTSGLGQVPPSANPSAKSLKLRFEAALSDYHAQKLDAARNELETLARELPASFDVTELLGLVYSAQGKYSQALAPLEEAVGLKPDSASAHLNFATALAECGKASRAGEEFRKAVDLDPSEENLNAWGSELLHSFQAVLASEVFQRGIKQYPRSARMWVGLGIALYARNQYAAAVQTLLQGADLRPEDPPPYFFLANAYLLAPSVSPSTGSAVVARMDRLMKLHPRNPQAVFYYARCLWKKDRERGKQEDSRQIESLLKESAELDPAFPGVHLHLGILYQSEGRNDEAIQALQKAIKLNPDLAVAHYRLAQVYVQAHEKALADQEFQTYERLHSQTTPQGEQEGTEIGRFLSSMQTPESKP
jgi:tetratricopeptide (TPR) repeat protein